MSLVLFDFCLIYFGIGVLEVLPLHVAVGIEGYTEATEKILFIKQEELFIPAQMVTWKPGTRTKNKQVTIPTHKVYMQAITDSEDTEVMGDQVQDAKV